MTLAASAVVGCTAIGWFVLAKNPRSLVNRYFGYFNTAIGFWNAGDFLVAYFRDNPWVALWADRVTCIGGVIFIGLYVRFYWDLDGEAKPPRLVRWFTNFMTPFLGLLMLTPYIIEDIRFEADGFAEVPGTGFFLFGFYLVWGILYGIYRLIILYRRTNDSKRIQIQYMLIAFGLGCVALVIYSAWIFFHISAGPPI